MNINKKGHICLYNETVLLVLGVKMSLTKDREDQVDRQTCRKATMQARKCPIIRTEVSQVDEILLDMW